MGRISVSIFFLFFFPRSSAKYLPGGNASDQFSFGVLGIFAPSQKAFWHCFPAVLGQDFLACGCFFLACHPSHFGARFGIFWAWSLRPIWPFFPVVIVRQDFLVSFVVVFARVFLSTGLVTLLISHSFSLGVWPLWPAIWALFWAFFFPFLGSSPFSSLF